LNKEDWWTYVRMNLKHYDNIAQIRYFKLFLCLHSSLNISSSPYSQTFVIESFVNLLGHQQDAPVSNLAIDGTCRDLLKHHAGILDTLKATPKALVSAAIAHCASLSAPPIETDAEPALPLHAYHFDPFFLWAPSAARASVVAWARDAFVIELAGTIEPFSGLPDDCAGDVLEYFEMNMPRAESMQLVAHCSSAEAYAWVHAVIMAAVLVR